jgi:uncharacterized protein YukE
MADGPQSFEQLVKDIDGKVQEVTADLVKKGNWVAEQLESSATGWEGWLDDLFGENEAKKALEKWNTKLYPDLRRGIDQLAGNVGRELRALWGDPAKLMAYSGAFTTAKATLWTPNVLMQEVKNLSSSWEGEAYVAYQTVAEEQNNALMALANNLQEGGRVVSEAAQKILDLWLDLTRQFVSFSARALSVIGSFADVSKVLSVEIPPIFDAIALIWEGVHGVADTLARFWVDQHTVTEYNWQKLTSGSDGMPQNKWPKIAESSSDAMSNPDKWPGAA